MTARLLLVDDEKIALRNLEHVLAKEGHQVTATQSGSHALDLLDSQPFDLVLTDMKMDKVDGMQLLRRCKAQHPDVEVIMITGFATLESAVAAMKEGAFHYIAKPFRLDEVRQTVAEALEKIRLKRENRALREQLDAYQGRVRVITRDGGMQKLLDMARQVAPTGCNVLITGESGTGKELFARSLHEFSGRPDGPFLAVNCGAFNEELLANELFGHEKGAFTGAVGKTGLLVAAHGGTLFLDEVTEMSPAMQVKLLRAIQEKEVLPVGGTRPAKVDVRFIAASNRNMKDWVAEGRFRQDLYFRLNVVNLHIPPLSQRREDIPLLAQHFLDRAAPVMGKPVHTISDGRPGPAQGLRLPRQRARTGEHHRARRRHLPGRHPGSRPPARRPARPHHPRFPPPRRPRHPPGGTGARLHPLGAGGSPRQPDPGGPDAGDRPGIAVAEVEEVRGRKRLTKRADPKG
jgi:two-component system response regulator HydG